MSCGVGHRRGSDPALLWLWCRPAAVALIGSLAWEPPQAAGAALNRQKDKKKKKKKKGSFIAKKSYREVTRTNREAAVVLTYIHSQTHKTRSVTHHLLDTLSLSHTERFGQLFLMVSGPQSSLEPVQAAGGEGHQQHQGAGRRL